MFVPASSCFVVNIEEIGSAVVTLKVTGGMAINPMSVAVIGRSTLLRCREKWRTLGRHGGIVARAGASLPALATRGDLSQLKGHANRALLTKIVRCWDNIAKYFGVRSSRGGDEVREMWFRFFYVQYRGDTMRPL